MNERGPGDVETKEFFAEKTARLTKTREDILSWFDLLDLEDHVDFGGRS